MNIERGLANVASPRSALPALERISLEIAQLSALVRAIERAQGAQRAHDRAAFSARVSEAEEIKTAIVQSAPSSGRALLALSEDVRVFDSIGPGDLPAIRTRGVLALPPRTGATQRRARRPKEFEALKDAGFAIPNELIRKSPVEFLDLMGFAHSIDGVAESLISFGRVLQEDGLFAAEE